MEKTIKVIMCDDKSIKITVNDEDKHIIEQQDRSISAATIYQIINFVPGDHYTVLPENESDVDNQVLEFFYELLHDITEKVNAISDS